MSKLQKNLEFPLNNYEQETLVIKENTNGTIKKGKRVPLTKKLSKETRVCSKNKSVSPPLVLNSNGPLVLMTERNTNTSDYKSEIRHIPDIGIIEEGYSHPLRNNVKESNDIFEKMPVMWNADEEAYNVCQPHHEFYLNDANNISMMRRASKSYDYVNPYLFNQFPSYFKPRAELSLAFDKKVENWLSSTSTDFQYPTVIDLYDEVPIMPAPDDVDFSDADEIIEYQARLVTFFVNSLYSSDESEDIIVGYNPPRAFTSYAEWDSYNQNEESDSEVDKLSTMF